MFFFLSVLTVYTFLTFTVRFLVRKANEKIWKSKGIDRIAFFFPYFAFLAIGLIIGSATFGNRGMILLISFTMAAVTLIFSFAAIFSIPFTFLTLLLSRIAARLSPPVKSQTPNPAERRKVLKWMAASAPVIFLGTASKGFADSFGSVKIHQVPMYFSDLPSDLENFKILHLSDLHLGYYFNLDDLERLIARLRRYSFDLVLITGDLADDTKQLKDALNLIDQLPSSHGAFFSLGNHEHFRDLGFILKTVEKSPVRLLRDESTAIQHKSAAFTLIGIDDPVFMHRNISGFLRTSVKKAMNRKNEDAFKILMSHRPRALDVSAEFGIDLILAGHTHGGQVGINRRSLFESVNIEKYLWGKYAKGKSQLYTSSGVGHWFPFRLGCPAETPVLILKSKAIT